MRKKSMLGGNALQQMAVPLNEHVSERASLEREFNKELACLVQAKGWLYAQRVANQIQNEFACTPKDDPHAWLVYTTIQYALNQFFSRIKLRIKEFESAPIPGQSILAELENTNGSRSRRNASKPSTTGASRRRRRLSS